MILSIRSHGRVTLHFSSKQIMHYLSRALTYICQTMAEDNSHSYKGEFHKFLLHNTAVSTHSVTCVFSSLLLSSCMLFLLASRSARTAAARSSSARLSSADSAAASCRELDRDAGGEDACAARRAALSEALNCFFRL